MLIGDGLSSARPIAERVLALVILEQITPTTLIAGSDGHVDDGVLRRSVPGERLVDAVLGDLLGAWCAEHDRLARVAISRCRRGAACASGSTAT